MHRWQSHGFADPLQTLDADIDPPALRAVYIHDQQQDGADEKPQRQDGSPPPLVGRTEGPG